MTPPGSLASQLSVAIAFAFLFGVAVSLPLNNSSLRWSAASLPTVGLRLTIVVLALVGTTVAVGLLPWLTWYVSVATLLLFAWPLLIPRSDARWDSLLLGVNTLLVVALALTVGVNRLEGSFWPGSVWGTAGTLIAASVAVLLGVRRPPRWPYFLAGYLALLVAFILETWMVQGPLPAAELVVYPLMIYFVMRTMITSRNRLAGANLDPFAFIRALSAFETSTEREALTYSGLRLISKFLHARYGLLFSGPDRSGSLGIEAAVDTLGERKLSVPPLGGKTLPAVSSSVVRGRAKIIRKANELAGLRDALGLVRSGEAMISPVALNGNRVGGLLLLASNERRAWTATDLRTLEAWAAYMGRKLSETDTGNGKQTARSLAISSSLDTGRDRPLGTARDSHDTPIGLLEDPETLRGELRLALEELAEVNAVESSDSMRSVGSLTAALVDMHDPIASIQGMLQGEAIGNLDVEQRKFLDPIRENISRLDRQLSSLLRLVREPSKAIQPDVSIHQIVDTASSQIDAEIRDKQVEIDLDLPEGMPLVHAEPDLLRQIVVILLERAVRITPKGAPIRVTGSSDEEQWVSIAVVDQGPGIAPEDIGRIFQRGSPAVGTDSGLPQVKMLTETLGGRVWIGSEIGAGSTVTVMIPASNDTASKEQGDTESGKRSDTESSETASSERGETESGEHGNTQSGERTDIESSETASSERRETTSSERNNTASSETTSSKGINTASEGTAGES